MAYTGVRHAHPFKARYAKGRAAATLYARYALLVAAPLAATYRSELLGFAAVAIGYWLLGFSWACHGLCWCFGFDDARALERCAAASYALVAGVVAARAG